jgi:hypothetical protein
MRVCIQDASRGFLEGMAKSLARTIDGGQTQNADGADLRDLLDQVIRQIPQVTEYPIQHRKGR